MGCSSQWLAGEPGLRIDLAGLVLAPASISVGWIAGLVGQSYMLQNLLVCTKAKLDVGQT